MSSFHLFQRVMSHFTRCEQLFALPVASRGGVGPDPPCPPRGLRWPLRCVTLSCVSTRTPGRAANMCGTYFGGFKHKNVNISLME